MFALWILCVTALVGVCPAQQGLKTLYEWKYIDYLWESNAHREKAVADGSYDHTKQVTMDVASWKNKDFVTILRNVGVPATLNTVSDKMGPGGPLLKPYPSWQYNNNGCDGLTGVYRFAIDKCNRLWALDTGKRGKTFVCPAQIHVFDLTTDRLIKRVPIPDELARNMTTGNGLLVTPIVEVDENDCDRYIVFVADIQGFGLIVYDGEKMWRHNSPTYNFDPKAATFTIEKESFYLADGILGLAVTPGKKENAQVYYRSLSSYDMNIVSFSDLAKTQTNPNINVKSYKNFLPSQAAAMAFSREGALFFVLAAETSLACWNYRNPVDQKFVTTVVNDPQRLQFGSGLKVINKDGTEYVYISSNRLQKVYGGTINYNEINFRILRGNVKELIANTNCLV